MRRQRLAELAHSGSREYHGPGSGVSGERPATDTLRPTLIVQNVTSDQNRSPHLRVPGLGHDGVQRGDDLRRFRASTRRSARPVSPKASGGKTSFTVEADLQPTTMFFWRARAIQGSVNRPLVGSFQFKSKLVGFNRAGELYDPLIHGETVGTPVGSTTFIQGIGIRINDGQSYVKYLLPPTITSGEFSMDVEGLARERTGRQDQSIRDAGRPGRLHHEQLSRGHPVSRHRRCSRRTRSTFRVIYGDGDDLDIRYEPDTNKRISSVFLLNPVDCVSLEGQLGQRHQLVMREGGVSGRTLYDFGMPARRACIRRTRTMPIWARQSGGAGPNRPSLPA